MGFHTALKSLQRQIGMLQRMETQDLSKTYAIHIRLDYPCPSPRNSTTRMIDDKFVWEKLYECKGRANAVVEAGNWFRSVKRVSTGKVLRERKPMSALWSMTLGMSVPMVLNSTRPDPSIGCWTKEPRKESSKNPRGT